MQTAAKIVNNPEVLPTESAWSNAASSTLKRHANGSKNCMNSPEVLPTESAWSNAACSTLKY
jgi:hypothetical protein